MSMDLQYRKATASASTNCVEVAFDNAGQVYLKDSKRPDAAPHVYTAAEWDAFLDGVRKGEFNRA